MGERKLAHIRLDKTSQGSILDIGGIRCRAANAKGIHAYEAWDLFLLKETSQEIFIMSLPPAVHTMDFWDTYLSAPEGAEALRFLYAEQSALQAERCRRVLRGLSLIHI